MSFAINMTLNVSNDNYWYYCGHLASLVESNSTVLAIGHKPT